ncbi:MAG: hypothetical protein JW760_10330 [Spirochaetales bacterium]|nr:hypothetical protein [Spirochaetales bacterium]
MEIRLNREPLDITMEDEKVLSDVVDELYRLIQDAGFHISRIQHNGEELIPEEKTSWADLPLEHVGVLDIEAKTLREATFEHLNTVRQYISMVRGAFLKENTPLLTDLSIDYPSVRDSLDPLISSQGPGNPLAEILDEQIHRFNVFSDQPLYKDSDSLIELLNSLLTLLAERMREISSPAEELKKSSEALKAMLGSLRDVSLLLQTGKDREAMALVLSCIELVSKIIRLYPLILDESGISPDTLTVGESSIKDFYSDFNATMEELIQAFQVNDSVLIGDLLEYEVAPRLESLLPSLADIVSSEERTQ